MASCPPSHNQHPLCLFQPRSPVPLESPSLVLFLLGDLEDTAYTSKLSSLLRKWFPNSLSGCKGRAGHMSTRDTEHQCRTQETLADSTTERRSAFKRAPWG